MWARAEAGGSALGSHGLAAFGRRGCVVRPYRHGFGTHWARPNKSSGSAARWRASERARAPRYSAARLSVLGGLGLGAGLGLGCGASYPESDYPPAPPAHVTPEVRALEPPPPGVIWKHDVLAALEAGLGQFLQRIDLKPELDSGQFIGFRVVALSPPSFWQGVDIRPGDILQSLNGQPIERATEAHAAFQSLSEASAINVDYLRTGNPRTLTFEIRAQPSAANP